MREIIRIPYPNTPAGKKDWSKRYSLNAYWAGKHHHQRSEDARFWHSLVGYAMNKAGCRKFPFEKPVVITIFWNDKLDLDNHAAMAKMIIDALKKRIIHDDSRKWVKGVEFYFHNDDCIKVVVWEIEKEGKE